MSHPTPNARASGSLFAALERWIFRAPDLDAAARGWQVSRPAPFRRVYRDPRWDSISACLPCNGAGCVACDGRGTVRLDTHADAAAVR